MPTKLLLVAVLLALVNAVVMALGTRPELLIGSNPYVTVSLHWTQVLTFQISNGLLAFLFRHCPQDDGSRPLISP